MGFLSRLGRGGEERAVALVGDGPWVRSDTVRSFGVTSAGRGQVRGTGTLVLGDDALVFALWVPKREWRIPRASIVGVDTPRGHLGKSSGRKLLRVHWITTDGAEDSIGLEVRDLDGWLAALGAPLIER